jgi:ubiquinone/menaquinone biosynthesis C-methylase UbiE
MTPTKRNSPGAIGTALSRQASSPHGLLGRLIGRIWITETAAANDAALDLLAPQADEHILEIGFGPGRSIGLLASRAGHVTGIDVSETMLARARRRNHRAISDGRVHLLHGDGTQIPLTDHTADAALAVHTIYFWPRPETNLAEIARVLRPGGRLVLALRNPSQPMPRRFDPATYTMRSTDQLTAMLTTAGFPNVEIHHHTDPDHPLVFLRASTTPRITPT